MAVIDHAVLARGGDDLAKLRYALAGIAQNATDGFHRFRGDDNDHPDPTVEGAQQFEIGDVALFGEPFENRQDRHSRQIDPDAKVLWQYARDVVGKSAARDMGERLDRACLPDRALA